MSNDTNTRASFRNLDAPVEVDPAFADRVRVAISAETSVGEPLVGSRSAPAGDPGAGGHKAPPLPAPETTRFRWQDWAAAAVLLIALAGLLTGAIRLMSTNENAKVAPPEVAENWTPSSPGNRHLFDAQSPVSLPESIANDGSIRGMAPVPGEYSKLWQQDVAGGWAAIFGDHVYYLDESTYPESQILVALDAATGSELWQQPSSARVAFAVTSDGVIAGLPGTEANTFRIALLDHWSGQPIWQSDTSYPGSDHRSSTLSVSEDRILFLDQEQLVVLNLKTGQEQWVYPVPETEGASCEPVYCDTQIAVSGTTVYIRNDWTNTIEAVDLGTGANRWARSLPETDLAMGTFLPSGALVAVDDGIVISLAEPVQVQGGRVEKWSEQTGETLWTILDYPFGFSFIRSGDELIVPLYWLSDDWLSDDELQIDRISIATGERLTSRIEGDPRKLSTLNVLPENGGAIIGGYRSGWSDPNWAQDNIPFFTSLFGEPEMHHGLTLLDPTTFESIREVEIEGCLIEMPVSITGDVLCRYGQSIAVYRPLNPPTVPSPDPAQDNLADVPADLETGMGYTADGLPSGGGVLTGGGGVFPGSAPSADDYVSLWSMDQNGPFPLISGDIVFNIRLATDGQATNDLVAYDLQTGEALWQTPVANASLAITDAGIVTAITAPESETSGAGVVIVLLDRETGAEIWRSSATYSLVLDDVTPAFRVSGGAVLFAVEGQGVVVLDLATGAERWQHPAEIHMTPYWLVASDGVVYYQDQSANTITALSLEDGSLLWGVSLSERFDSTTRASQLIATPLGVVVRLAVSTALDDVALWARVDGSPVWHLEFDYPLSYVVSTGDELLITSAMQFDRVNLASGEGSSQKRGNGVYITTYLPEADLLLGYGGNTTSYRNVSVLDPDTLDVIWTGPDAHCQIHLPVGPGGELVCDGYGRQTIYAPVAPEASPVAASTPTPVAAPELAGVPVINLAGSAANDGNLPGVMPPLGSTYDLLWDSGQTELDPAQSVPDTWIAGDVVITTSVSGEATFGPDSFVIARSRATGGELWRVDDLPLEPLAITPRGVLILTGSTTSASTTFRLVLLDLHTGRELWSTGEQFSSPDRSETGLAKVDGDTVYIMDGETRLVALDLATGAERWAFDGAQGRTKDEMNGECIPTHPECGGRAYLPGAMAIVGDVAYRYIPRTGELFAINTADGSVRWVHNLAERTSISAPTVRLIGTQFGVIPVVTGSSTAETPYLGFWEVESGAEIWFKDMTITGAYVDMEVLGVVHSDPENPSQCCLFTGIEIPTESDLGETMLDDLRQVAWFPESDVLALVEAWPVLTSEVRTASASYIFNATSEGTTEPIPAEQVIPGCAQITPGTDGVHVVCTRPNGQFAIYQAVPFAENVDSQPTPGQVTDGCFDQGDTVWTNEEAGVRFRETPGLDGAVLQELAIGTPLVIIDENATVDAEGNTWCRVRYPEAGQTGYVMEQFLVSEPPAETTPELADVPMFTMSGPAANDGNLPGVMPQPGSTYDLLWDGPEPEVESGYSSNRAWIAGDYVVRANGTYATGVYLGVHDLATGAEIWRTDLSLNFPYAITPRGILIALPTGPDEITPPLDYGLTLHNLATGVEIWSTGDRFVATDFDTPVMIAAGETVYLRDGETGLVALDLATGAERWTFDAAQDRTPEEMLGECTPDNTTCGQRSELTGTLVIVGDAAYWYVPQSGELIAINTADGSVRWSVNLSERLNIPVPIVRLIGTEFGVIPVVIDHATGNFAETYVGLWSAVDGAEQWAKSLRYLSAVVVGDQLLMSWADPAAEGDCCQLSRFSIATGESVGEETTPDLMVSTWYPESNSLVLGDTHQTTTTDGSITPAQSVVFGVGDGELYPVPAEQVIPGCEQITPGTDGEHVVCTRPTGQFAIYRAVPIAENVDSLPTPGQTTDGCFEVDDHVTVTEEAVNLREAPGFDADIARQLEEGAVVMIIAPDAEVDAEGNTWCRVRDNETALVGYVAEEFLTLAEP